MPYADQESLTLNQMLLSGVRLDGRSLKEYREISFNFPSGHPHGGCCITRIGSTSVLAKVTAEIVEPKHYRPAQGVLFVNFDASIVALLEGKRRGKSRDDEGRRLSSVLQTCFRDSIDLDALCIVAWERVFAIRVDLRALSFDGNLGDCGALAAVAALASFRRPDVYVSDGGKVIVDTEMKHRPPVRLNLRRIPVLVTLGLASDTKVVLQDPTKREEAILTGGRVMVGLTAHGELCCLHTSGLTTPIRLESLNRCVVLANARARSLVALVQRVLEGLDRQRSAAEAARTARLSEFQAATQQLLDVPLVLSSSSFLPGGANAPEGYDNLEEGEVVAPGEEEGDDEMEVATTTSEEEETEVKTGKPVKRDPYGVIEVSSLLAAATNQRDEEGDYGEGLDQLGGETLEADAAAITHSFLPPRGRRGSAEQQQQRKYLAFLDEEEEESTTVVQLL